MQACQILDKSYTFKDQFSLSQIIILKSPRFVPLDANLTQFVSLSDSPVDGTNPVTHSRLPNWNFSFNLTPGGQCQWQEPRPFLLPSPITPAGMANLASKLGQIGPQMG